MSSSLQLSQMSTEVLTDGQSSSHQLLPERRHIPEPGKNKRKTPSLMPNDFIRGIFCSADSRKLCAAMLTIASAISLDLIGMGYIFGILFLYCACKHTI